MPSAARKSDARPTVSAARPASRGRAAADEAGPLIIAIGRQWDGCTYMLDPPSRRRVRAAHPGVHPAPSVFVGYKTRAEFETVHGSMWTQIATMLAGVGVDRLRALGGVELHDPRDGWRKRIV